MRYFLFFVYVFVTLVCVCASTWSMYHGTASLLRLLALPIAIAAGLILLACDLQLRWQLRKGRGIIGIVTVLEWNYAARSGAKGVTLKVMPDDRANTPVVNVSWLEAQAYLAWLNYRAESPARFRLPTEAEWEYVAKCARVSTLSAPSGGAPPVGGVAESSWGVFDLPGAVLEWVEDVYADSHAGASPIGEARTQPVSETRVVRGRSWRDDASAKGVTARGAFHERYAADDIGFRIVRELP